MDPTEELLTTLKIGREVFNVHSGHCEAVVLQRESRANIVAAPWPPDDFNWGWNPWQ